MLRPKPNNAFTLLELLIALTIGLLMFALAVPAIGNALAEPPSKRAIERLKAMAQTARDRSQEEGRNYVMLWGRDQKMILRPESPLNATERTGIDRWKPGSGRVELHLPAALLPHGKTPEAVWTFWPDGSSEPAEVHYSGPDGKWSVRFGPFTAQAEVLYE